MQLSSRFLSPLVILWAVVLGATAASWGFDDATVSVQDKKAGIGGSLKQKFADGKPLSKPVSLGSSDTLKVLVTTKEGSKAKRPHQAFLLVKDPKSSLETSFAFQVKENGKGKLDLSHKDIPTQLLSSSEPLDASLIIGSFGTTKPYKSHVFDLSIETEAGTPKPAAEKPVRYGKLPEIHHTFKSDPKSPPLIITMAFTLAVIVALPTLLGTWALLGANLNHVQKAFGSAPVPHALFFCSIVAMEGVFFMYYTSWNLFQTLPGAVGIGLVTFLSGSRALREVQQRRLAGLR